MAKRVMRRMAVIRTVYTFGAITGKITGKISMIMAYF